MAGKRDITWVADRVHAVLQAHLPGQMSALDSLYNDGLTLEPIPASHYFIAEQVAAVYPMVLTVCEKTDVGADDGSANYEVERHTLVVGVGLTANAGEDALKRRCCRTLRAVQEVLETHPTLDDTVVHLFATHKDYSPMYMGEGALGQEAHLEIVVLINAVE